MSSSPRAQNSAGKPERAAFQAFPYDDIPAGSASGRDPNQTTQADSAASREALARAQGRQEGQAEALRTFEERLSRERSALAEALSQFSRDRIQYFQKVESDVVQLALSITRKILHRESQIDPLLLAGMTRVALEKIDGATHVVLRVHPAHAAGWKQFLAQRLEQADLPEIAEDPALPLDQCILQTSMGTAVLGIDVQLKEIEQGLMDLLASRPGGTG